jgi:hypothetical protein
MIDCTEQEREIAAMLLAREEGEMDDEVLLDWGRAYAADGIKNDHAGDCTKQPFTCSRCVVERALRDARSIIAVARRVAA